MINQNSPPNLLINVIQKKYNSFNGVISNKIKTFKNLYSDLYNNSFLNSNFLNILLKRLGALEYIHF